MVLIRHVGQILDVHMDAAGIIRLDGLHRHLGAGLPGHQRLEVRHAVAAQTAAQARARDLGVDESRVTASKSSRGSRRVSRNAATTASWAVAWSPLGAVRGTFHPLALAPFRNRVTVEVVSLGQQA